LTKKDVKKNVDEINKFKPITIVGYPSALHFLALEIEKNNLQLTHLPKGVISAGETLHLHQREIIEKVFKTQVYNRYGSREFGHIANECLAHEGLHYNADDLIIEIVDEKGMVCKSGQIGRLIITDLNNYAFPLIRYDIGDLGSMSSSENCCCGCTFPKLSAIEGRTFDIIYGINGNKVSGTFWTLSFRNKIQGVDAFQIRQFLNYDILINIKTNKQFNELENKKIRQLISENLGEKINITINDVTEFEYTKTGKFNWISSELNK